MMYITHHINKQDRYLSQGAGCIMYAFVGKEMKHYIFLLWMSGSILELGASDHQVAQNDTFIILI